MSVTDSKAIISGVAALSLAASLLASAQPASAAQWRGGGCHVGGTGGWHGGYSGWHGGGYWRPRLLARRRVVQRLVGSGDRNRTRARRGRRLSVLWLRRWLRRLLAESTCVLCWRVYLGYRW
jgi:hypothetical protein